MGKSCTVVLAFIENYDKEFIMKYVESADYVICADAGQKLAAKYGFTPDVVIGDFDSTDVQIHLNCKYITYPVEKDITDAEACVLHCIDEGIDNITFLGGIGGRLDHTLGALSLLVKFKSQVERITLIDKRNQIELLENASLTFAKDLNYRFFSIVPVYEEIHGVTITGAKYPLTDVSMVKASTLGISNEIVSDEATITIKDGLAYIIRSND